MKKTATIILMNLMALMVFGQHSEFDVFRDTPNRQQSRISYNVSENNNKRASFSDLQSIQYPSNADAKNQVNYGNFSFEGFEGPAYGQMDHIAFDPLNEGTIYVSGHWQRQIFKSTDLGQTWEHFYSCPPMPYWGSEVGNLRFANPQRPTNLYFTVTTGSNADADFRGLYIIDVSTGELVRKIQLLHLHHQNFIDYDVNPHNPDKIVVVTQMKVHMNPIYQGSLNMVWKSENGGESFELIYDNEDYDYKAALWARLLPENPETVLVGRRDGLFRSTDGGATWNHYEVEGGMQDAAINHQNPNTVFAITGSGTSQEKVIRSFDGGETWEILNCEFNSNVINNMFTQIEIDPSQPENVWATSRDEIFVSQDGGETWQSTIFEQNTYDTYFYGTVIGINPFNSDHLIIGSDYRIVETFNKGETWDLADNIILDVYYVDAVKYPNGDAYIYAEAPGSYFVKNLQNNNLYGDFDLGTPIGNYHYLFADEYTQGRAFLGRPDGSAGIKIYQTDDYFLSTPSLVYSDHEAFLLSRVVRDPHNPQVYWFVTPEDEWLGDAKIMRTFNGFSSTTRLSITGEENELITALVAVEGQPGVLWTYAAGWEYAGIYKSTDYGNTWHVRSNGLPVDIGVWDIAVNPNNPDNLVATVSMGYGIYVTMDGGNNWNPAFTDFECTQIKFSKTHENVAFALRRTFAGVVYSENGGLTWQEVPSDILIDANYYGFDIIDNEKSIDIYMCGEGINILKYTFIPKSAMEKHQINFRLDMSQAEGFDPALHDVYISGSFSDEMFWDVPGSNPELILSRVDESMIYSISLELIPGYYEYKYASDAFGEGWNGGEWTGDPNREITVDEDKTLYDVWGIHPDELSAPVFSENSFNIYPNPASTGLTIESNEIMDEIRIINVLGQQILSTKVGDTSYRLNVSGIENGMYIIMITNVNGTMSKKFQIRK